MTTMSGKTCLVTGATSGIGKVTAARLAELGATVVVVARDPERGAVAARDIRRHAPHAQVVSLTADLAKMEDVRKLAAQVLAEHDRLDVLVNNAGVVKMRHELTADGLEATFAINHLAPFLLTNLLRERLERSAPARVVTVASGVHKQVQAISWDDLPRGGNGSPAAFYNVSKLLNVLFTYELARRLAGTGVTANCLHPGLVRTGLGREVTGVFGALLRVVLPFVPSPRTGARTSVYLASAPEVADVSGRYFFKRKPAPSSALSHDQEAARRLWTLSAELTGLDPS